MEEPKDNKIVIFSKRFCDVPTYFIYDFYFGIRKLIAVITSVSISEIICIMTKYT